jgi:hypothetical protein
MIIFGSDEIRVTSLKAENNFYEQNQTARVQNSLLKR